MAAQDPRGIEGLSDAVLIAESDLVIEEKIGEGSFASVFKADYFGFKVAVKKLQSLESMHPELATFIAREVAVLKEVRHPLCCQFMGICKIQSSPTENDLWIVSEYVPYGALSELLDAKSVDISWKLRMRFALDAAQALAYLHSKNIIHRDLKCENFLLSEGLRVKMADFGFARTTGQAGTRGDTMNTVCGTEPYMAPELALGMPYNASVDVFSFGIASIEIMTRVDPEDISIARNAQDAFALDEDRVRAAVPSDCPAEFLAIALSCCTYDAIDRPSFVDVVKRLKECFDSLPETPGWDKPSRKEKKVPKTAVAFSPRLSVMAQGTQLTSMLSRCSIANLDSLRQLEESEIEPVKEDQLTKEAQDAIVKCVVEMVQIAKLMLQVEGNQRDVIFAHLMELIGGPLKRYTELLGDKSKDLSDASVAEAVNLVSLAKSSSDYPNDKFTKAVVKFMNNIRNTVRELTNR